MSDTTSTERAEKGTDSPGQTGTPDQPTDAQLAEMSQEELVELGGRLDGVETVYKEPPLAHPRHQGREARRAHRRVLASAGRRLGPRAAAGLPVLAVGVQAVRIRGRVPGTRWPLRSTV